MTIRVPLEVRQRSLGALRLQHRARTHFGLGFGLERTADAVRTIIDASPPETLCQGESSRILFLSLRGWPEHIAVMGTVARALMLRGVHCSFLTCGGGLPDCEMTNETTVVGPPCHACSNCSSRLLESFQLPYHERREFVEDAEVRHAQRQCSTLSRSECERFSYRDVPLGQLVRASMCNILRRKTLEYEGNGNVLSLYRRLLASGLVLVDYFEEAFRCLRPDVLVTVNGLFFAEAIATFVARRAGIPFTTFEGGFLQGTYAFAHNAPAGYWDHISHVWPTVAKQPLSLDEDERLDGYLTERRRGGGDVSYLWDSRMETESDYLTERLGLRRDLPLFVAFSNVIWDSAVLDRDVAFSNMMDWLFATVELFSQRPDWQLIIRVHPAELRLVPAVTREPVVDRLRERFHSLPANVRVIPPEDRLDSYTIMRDADAGIVYTSSTGLEMALMGKPVCVAAQVHYRDRGFTIDVAQRVDLSTALETALTKGSLTDAEHDLARRYMSLLAFGVSIPLSYLSVPGTKTHFDLSLQSMSDLLPDVVPVVDFICERLLDRQPIILPRDPSGDLGATLIRSV